MSDFVDKPLTFTAARDWMARKVNLPTGMNSREIANNLPGRIRMQSFLSAKVANAGILEALRGNVTDIVDGKIGYGEARKRMTELLAKQGYGVPMPGTAEDRDVQNIASTSRLELILRQNTAMAHAIGQREVSENAAVKELFPNYKYVAVMDEATRETHAELNDLILPKDDPFWDTHYPPWEFNCRCMVVDTDEPASGKAVGFDESKAPEPDAADDTAQTGVVSHNGRVLNLLPNKSGFVFRSNPREAFADPDFERIKDPAIREMVQGEWNKKAAVLMPGESKKPIAVIPSAPDATLPLRDDLKRQAKTEGLDIEDSINRIPISVLKAIPKMPAIKAGIKGAFYSPLRNTIELAADKNSWEGHPTTFDHEFGHGVHTQTNAISGDHIEPSLDKAMTDDYAQWKNKAKAEHGDSWRLLYSRKLLSSAMSQHLKKLGLADSFSKADIEIQHRAIGLWDTIGGLSKGNYGYGHSKKDYAHAGGIGGKAEAYANIYRAIINGWSEYEQNFPLTSKWIRNSLGL